MRKTRKSKPIFEKIFEPVYRFDFLFMAGCSLAEANKHLKGYEIDPIPDQYSDSSGMMFSVDEKTNPKAVKGKVFAIWIKNKKDFYTLLHEVDHLVIKVFEEKSMSISDATTEAFAYYQEFWFKKLWRLMNERR